VARILWVLNTPVVYVHTALYLNNEIKIEYIWAYILWEQLSVYDLRTFKW